MNPVANPITDPAPSPSADAGGATTIEVVETDTDGFMATQPSPADLERFSAGNHHAIHRFMGAHVEPDGCLFRVWAPNAKAVSIIGDFNGWQSNRHPMRSSDSGVWTGWVPGAQIGDCYKYAITPEFGDAIEKADPMAFATEEPPRTASKIWAGDYQWTDDAWMESRRERNRLDGPVSIYEVHLGSWRYEPGGYRALAHQLADHLDATGFTHVELMPVMEHPFYGSWGYQMLSYFAPTARYGRPEDLMYLVDVLHKRGYGVILDWVPSHFPVDSHGMAAFDGTHLYEHADPRLGFHPDWTSAIFNYDRHEVRSYLLSSAHYWVERFHIDGLRVDGVASMLYRNYSRPDGEWIPNDYGGKENLGAVTLLQELNRSLYGEFDDIMVMAEESTAWPGVTTPTDFGGLGFGYKWDMGWMNDTLEYVSHDPVHRGWHHGELTFRMVYANDENYVLPLSHDEVAHGKGSLLSKQPGDSWQKFAGLRALLGYQYALPGKKLLFMGAEFGVRDEWRHDQELDWGLLQHDSHGGVAKWVKTLNSIYRTEPALHRLDRHPDGFGWVVLGDSENSVVAFVRSAGDEPDARDILVVCNFTPVPRHNYRLGVPHGGSWSELANSDAEEYWGSGVATAPQLPDPIASHGYEQSITMTVPPSAICFLTCSRDQ